MLASEAIDLTNDEDEGSARSSKRPRTNSPAVSSPYAQHAYSPHATTQSLPYPTTPAQPHSPYPQQAQWQGQTAAPQAYDARTAPQHAYRPSPTGTPQPYYQPQPAYTAGAPNAPPYYGAGRYPPAPGAKPAAQPYPSAYPAQAQPHQVIDLTGPGASGPVVQPPPPLKDVRKDVVCIGQLTVTALVLYPISYVCTPAQHSGNSYAEEFVPVRLRYESPAKKRARNQEETINITSPHMTGPSGETIPGDDFGVVEQRAASVLGPMMGRVLIRLEATVRRSTSTTPILQLRILVFTPRGNVPVVSNHLHQNGLLLDHPSVPYDPSRHRDTPPYMNPHNPPVGGFRTNGVHPQQANRWSQNAPAGKSVEVQRSQVDEVFQSLKSGEDLTETDAGPNVATNLYPHQKKALTFLLEREKEKTSGPNQLWKVRKDGFGKPIAWKNAVTDKEINREPIECKGAILADDMGLGKTISVVSLMANTMDSARVFAYGPIQKITLKVPKSAPEPLLTAAHFAGQVWGMPEISGQATDLTEQSANGSSGPKGKGKREEQRALESTARAARIKCKSRATLIVCPLSTIVNWEDQFKEHWNGEVSVVGGASGALPCPDQSTLDEMGNISRRGTRLKLYVYHGQARRPNPDYLADFDAVITTYSTLATEYSKQTKSTALYEDDSLGGQEEDSGSDSFSDMDDNGTNVIRLKEKKKPKKRPPGAALAAGLEVSSALQQIHWFRIVLDEAHSIKETSTIASRACCDLVADRRLCLTGTPVQNKLDDVYALIKFLRFDPFDDKSVWTEYIGGPAKFGQSLGVRRLQTIMKSVTLRRTKESKDANGKAILNLPPRSDEVRYLKFDETEKAVYASYYDESKAEFSAMRKNNEVMKNYVGILQKILRLRQICDHYELVKGKDESTPTQESSMDYGEIAAAIARDGINIPSATAIFALLREAGTAQCVECGSDLATPGGAGLLDGSELETAPPPKRGGGRKASSKMAGSRGPTRASSPTGNRPVLTKCQHLFCIECFRLSICPNWPKVSPELHRACTACQADLVPHYDAVEVSPDGVMPNDVVKARPAKKEKRQKGAGLAGYNASTKVKALMGDLMETSRTNPNSQNYDARLAADIQMTDENGMPIDDGLVKTIVFSQWTSMLDKIEDALEDANIKYDRLDGTMKREERTRAMEALKHDPVTEVLLVSLRAGGVGLNLTAARRVYLMDPYWNPAVENQAVDRIHRLGQTHPVKTVKMIMENSIETRLLEVQARKTQLANLTLGQPLSKAEMMQRRMEELSELFAE